MCNRVNKSDYYYGAFLSNLLDKERNPVLVEKDSNRRVYEVLTHNTENYIYMKYVTISKGRKLWNFTFSKDNLREIEGFIKQGRALKFVFICSYKNLIDTEIGVCSIEEFKLCTDFECKTNERQRISILKKPHSSYLTVYGTALDRDNGVEIDRYGINNL